MYSRYCSIKRELALKNSRKTWQQGLLVCLFFVSSLILCSGSLQADYKDRGKGFREEDFNFTFPNKIQILLDPLTETRRAEIVDKCSNDPNYTLAMKQLEQSVAQVLANHSVVKAALNTMTTRLLESFTKVIALRLQENEKTAPSDAVLRKKVDEFLVSYYGRCSSSEAGCVGPNPDNIRTAFASGNPRETSNLTWNRGTPIYETLFGCSSGRICICNILATSPPEESKSQKDGVQGDVPVTSTSSYLNGIRETCELIKNGTSPLEKGRYARESRSFRRHSFSDSDTGTFAKESLLIPLSEREETYLKSVNGIRDGKIHYDAGMSFQESTAIDGYPDPTGLYYKSAKKFGFAVAVSPSGTADNILTLAHVFGLNVNEIEGVRAAALGYLIALRHHTAYEVLVTSKSFRGLSMNLNSDYYKYLFPSNPKLSKSITKRIERTYRKLTNEMELPTQVYQSCVVDATSDVGQPTAGPSSLPK